MGTNFITYDYSNDNWFVWDGHWYGHDVMGDPPETVSQMVDDIVRSYSSYWDDRKNPNYHPDDFIFEIHSSNFNRSMNKFKGYFNFSRDVNQKLKKELQKYLNRINPNYLTIDANDIDNIINYNI